MQRVKKEESHPSPSAPSPLASPLPSGAYTDYVLYSAPPSSSTGWRYNIMKFGALGERTVDPTSDKFLKPVKLNRKDPRTVRRLTDEDRERINKRILERNGVDVEAIKGEEGIKGEDGKFVKKEREQIDLTLVGTGKSGLAPALRNKNNMFKKKTKRVFVSSEEARRLKREEWMPWVLEDDEGNERWIGRLEGGVGERPAGSASTTVAQEKQAKADANGTGMKGWRPPPPPSEAGGGGSSYVAFVNDPDKEGFQVVPVHRWYKFSQGPKYVTLGTEEAETEYERQQKNQDAERWVMHKRNQPAAASSTASKDAPTPSASFKPTASSKSTSKSKTSSSSNTTADSSIRSRLLDKSVASGRRLSGAPASSRKFKSVISVSGERDDDDELGGKGRKDDGAGGEQGDDEFDYDEEFQDDEEGIAKIDDLADEQETKELEERIKKEMRAANRYEGVPEDDDDDEEDWEELTNTGKDVKKLVKKNDRSGAYDSDEDSSDDNASIASNEPSKDSKDASRSSSARPSAHQRTNSTSSTRDRDRASSTSRHPSRAGSPSGSALVAKRATSPTGSASGSGKKSRNSSPGPSGSAGGGKRKRPDGGDESDGGKRRKNGGSPAPGEGSGNLISEADLVALFKTKEGHSITTQEVLSHFKRAFKSEPRNKAAIGGLLQTVANLVGGKLVLKAGY